MIDRTNSVTLYEWECDKEVTTVALERVTDDGNDLFFIRTSTVPEEFDQEMTFESGLFEDQGSAIDMMLKEISNYMYRWWLAEN